MKKYAFSILLLLVIASVAPADWRGFRGTRGDGTTQQAATPTKWNATDGMRWKTPMPAGGNGSPIVVGDQVFVATAEDAEGQTRSLICFDANSGESRWTKRVDFGRTLPTHKTNPYGGSTPASDGERVFVWHGSAGLFAYDLQGELLWSRDLGTYQHMWGYGTSPIVVGDLVLLHTGPGEQVYLIAFDAQSGEERWRHAEPVAGNGERNEAGNYMGSWSTPVIHQQDDRTIAVCAFATRVCGFDVATGQLEWWCRGLIGERGDLAYSSPMLEQDLAVMVGGFRGPAFAFLMQGKGDLTANKRLWRNEKNPQSIGTGILIDGYVYRPGAGPNFMECIEGRTGEVVWQERAGNAPFWSSVAFDGQHAYVTNQRGATFVFRPSPERFDLVAENRVGEQCNATPALTDGRVYLRTYDHVWCIDGRD